MGRSGCVFYSLPADDAVKGDGVSAEIELRTERNPGRAADAWDRPRPIELAKRV